MQLPQLNPCTVHSLSKAQPHVLFALHRTEVTWHVTFDGLDTELRSGHVGSLTSSAPGLLLSLWAAPMARFGIHPLSQTFQLEALELPLPL